MQETDEKICIDLDEPRHCFYPDVAAIELPEIRSTSSSSSTVAVADAVIANPTLIPVPSEHPTQRHIEIVDLNSRNHVVTAIELLSPAHKQEGSGRIAYGRKQRQYIEAGVNLVEIDFIRAGTFIVAAPEAGIPWQARTPYQIFAFHFGTWMLTSFCGFSPFWTIAIVVVATHRSITANPIDQNSMTKPPNGRPG